MTFRLLAALFLSLIAAQPAWAQADKFDAGDWWWVDVTGDGTLPNLFLTNGEGVRRGDRVELDVFMIFREPDENGVSAVRVRDIIDCAGKTRANGATALIYADGRIVEPDSAAIEERGAIDPETSMFIFACSTNRSHATHIGPGSRRQVAVGLFDKYPEE